MTSQRGNDEAHRGMRRPLVAVGSAAALAAAAGLAWVQTGAGADPVSTDVAATCSILGTTADVTVPMTVDDAVDPIAPGGHQTLTVTQGLGALPVEVTVDKLVVTTPVPGQIASTDAVSFEGGNMAGSWAVDGTNLVVTFTGPQSSSQLQFPTVKVDQTVSGEPEGSVIEWKVWSQMVIDTNYGQATCTPNDPNANLNTTAIEADDPTPTVPGDGTPGTTPDPTLPGGGGTLPPVTTPPATDPTTPTTPPVDPGTTSPSPGLSVCVKVTTGLPLPTGAIPCPIEVPPSGGGGIPAPGDSGLPGLPPLTLPSLPSLPALPAPGDGGLPVPVPDLGSGELPVPLPGAGDGGIGLEVDAQLGLHL